MRLANSAEGLVHISGLGDYYEYDKDRNRLVGAADTQDVKRPEPDGKEVIFRALEEAGIQARSIKKDGNSFVILAVC